MAEKLKVSLNLQRLVFGPSTKTNQMVITNDGDETITFKLKTSTPLRYIVKPRLGCVDPGATETVSVSYKLDPKDKDLSAIRDRFQLEVRELAENEKRARRAQASGDLAKMKEELGSADLADVGSMCVWIWKNPPPSPMPSKNFHLDCVFGDGATAPSAATPSRSDQGAFSTPRRPTPGTSDDKKEGSATPRQAWSQESHITQVQENERLKADLRGLEKKKSELYSKNQTTLAAADELRSKSEKGGVHTIPGWLFVILWLACFYFGLVFDRLYTSSEEPS